MRDYLQAYCAGERDLLDFYGPPIESLWQPFDAPAPWTPELVDSIRRFNAERGKDAAMSGNEAVIVTGQQPGLFTGPLYTIYKAVTTVKVAQLHELRTGVPTLPVFWVGSEDHDFDEARTIHYLTRQHVPESFSYDPPVRVDGMPMYRVPLNGALHDVIDTLAAQTNGSEYSDVVQDLLHETLDAADSLADWTTRLLVRLFKDTPLVFFAPHLPTARRLTANIIEREIEAPCETSRQINQAAQQLAKIDFEPQIVKANDECSFFLEMDGRRRKLLFQDDRFVVPDVDQHFDPAQLRSLLATAPERFSPNVALRCAVQQQLFPVRAYIAGPSELAYWAQLRRVFERHRFPMPVVYPRAQVVLTSRKLNQLLEKFSLNPTDLLQHEDELVDVADRNSSNNPLLAKLHAQKQTVDRELEQLRAELDAGSPTAARMVKSLEHDVDRQFERLERTVLHEDQARQNTVRNQIQRLCNTLAPFRKPQERVYTVMSFLFSEGPGLIDRLIDEVDVESFALNEVEL